MSRSLGHHPLLLAFLSVLLLVASAVANSTLTQRRTIGGHQRLASPGGAFQLGLFSLANNTKWFLGIWFAASPDAVVWVANRDRPLDTSSSGVVMLSSRGALVLLDAASDNETIWSSSKSNSSTAAVARLQDDGNLVLADSTGAVQWQSFDHPTNTFLSGSWAGQDLRTGAVWSASSWRGADDPSAGDFRYVMDTRGSPELHVWRKGRKTYRTGPWNGVRFSGCPGMTTFEDLVEFQFTHTADEVSYVYRDRVGSPVSRMVLTESGEVQRMVWNPATLAWSVFWSVPRDQCDVYGVCGPFGVCNAVGAVVCGCIRGFLPRSPAEWRMRNSSGGCARSTPLQCGDDGFYVLRGVKLPETHNSSVDAGASLAECGRRCLSNCYCTAYAASDIRGGGTGCIQWFGELMDTRLGDDGQDLFVKLAMSELETTKTNKLVVVIAAVITTFALLLLSLGLLIWRKIRQRNKQVTEFDDIVRGECPAYHLETIKAATNGFCPKNEIGCGGFGTVYKGQMIDGQEIAVKKLSAGNRVQGLKEFKNEVDLIAKLQHRNLVRLLGYCIHHSERILVYEYMSNKSLDTFIFDPKRRATLSWKTRMDIIFGIARGLLYLHQDSRHTMIHRDLKAANVLLNREMVAKISDFGIAKLFSSIGDHQVTERIVGTYGYMSPEYAMDGMVSFMQDVYSFGVLLLEIISGRRNQRSFNLIAHAWGLFEENKSIELLDPAVRDGRSPTELEQAATCIQVGLLCVQESPSQRPQMASVIPMLSHQQVPGRPLRPVVCMPVSSLGDLLDVQEDTSGNAELTITNLEGR
ncbi:receptor-like serine/threonine-protein kinase SD1-8 [Triticum dicoccoides]|uniref:receptor-like serine/threonine-protein kinase SD1-8 n=1 Tax=Triticum dicoccoides TaxID=85692 RepID=UPI00188FBE16|nr:receptor-like serine/threonine-protein kinase SD1-8 [Triticum dicoccoides]